MQIRNVAIIAHVDHGKTTIVDAILRQTGIFKPHERLVERVMDRNDLERERGITILSKNTAVNYRDVKINIVDTPGHSDFGGEVERIMGMVDGAVLVVDAFEGPMPQTRFVLQKALSAGLAPVVVINKVDRADQRSEEVLSLVFDLFCELGATEQQLDFAHVYCSATRGFAGTTLQAVLESCTTGDGSIFPLLDTVIERVPPPTSDSNGPLEMLVANLDYDDYVGRLAIGRIWRGRINTSQQVAVTRGSPHVLRTAKVTALYTFSGLKRVETQEALSGDIVALTGLDEVQIGDTITDPEQPGALPPIEVDEPTLVMVFGVNDSPFAGRDGKYVTSRHLRDRLFREQRTNVSLNVSDTEEPDKFVVAGRGELHLAILIENMRREGYEIAVSKPRVILKQTATGQEEPLENLVVDVPSEYLGAVMQHLGERKAEMLNMIHTKDGRVRVDFIVPARGLVGFNSLFMAETNGRGVMYYSFAGYGAYRGEIPSRQNGVLVAWETGTATAYAIGSIQERARLFISPGEEVYPGMIIGENSREYDMDVNICKKRHLTNIRSSTQEITTRIDAPKKMSLEEALAYIAEDELVEITPRAVRLRKKILDRESRRSKRSHEK